MSSAPVEVHEISVTWGNGKQFKWGNDRGNLKAVKPVGNGLCSYGDIEKRISKGMQR